jgi:hypothetical protein
LKIKRIESGLEFEFRTKAIKFDDEEKRFYSCISSFLSGCDFIYWTDKTIYFLEVKDADFFITPKEDKVYESIKERVLNKLKDYGNKLEQLKQEECGDIKDILHSIQQSIDSLTERLNGILLQFDKKFIDENVKEICRNFIDTVGSLLLAKEDRFDLGNVEDLREIQNLLVKKEKSILNIVINDNSLTVENLAQIQEAISGRLESTLDIFDIEIIVESAKHYDDSLKKIYPVDDSKIKSGG